MLLVLFLLTFVATLDKLRITPFLAVLGEIECDSTALASMYHPQWMKRLWYEIKLDWIAVFGINSIQYRTPKRDTRLSIEVQCTLVDDIFQSPFPQFCNYKLNKRACAERWKEKSSSRREWTGYFLETIWFKTFHPIVTKIRRFYSWDCYYANKGSIRPIWFHLEIISFGDVMICLLYYCCELRPDGMLFWLKPPPKHLSNTQVVIKQMEVVSMNV